MLGMSNILSWERTVLANGLRILRLPRASDSTVRLCFAVEYGSNNDSPEKSGLAHFLEHLLVGGSKRRIQSLRKIERLGGFLDCMTTPEYTIIISHFLPEEFLQVSGILSEISFDRDFQIFHFRKEKKVVLEEVNEIFDDPWKRIDQMVRESLFRKNPIMKPPCGIHETVDRLSLETVMKTHQANYVPNNMILVLTGKYREKDLQKAQHDFWEHCSSGSESERPPFLEDAKPVEQNKIAKRTGLSQTYFAVGVKTVPRKHQDSSTLDTINFAMGATESSRLFRELREKRGLAYSVGSYHTQGSDYGYFVTLAAVKKRNLDKALKLVQSELLKLRIQEMSNTELNTAKVMLKGDVIRSFDSPTDCPNLLVEAEIMFHNKNSIIDYLERVKSVSKSEVTDVADKYLCDENLATVVLCS